MKKQIVDENYKHIPPVLNDKGQEVLSPVSLVAGVDLRPRSLGERIRRYERTPQFLEDLKAMQDMEIDEEIREILDDDENPISPHEDRYRELAERIKTRKAKEVEEAKTAEIERQKAEKLAFRNKLEELRKEGLVVPELTPSPLPPEKAE